MEREKTDKNFKTDINGSAKKRQKVSNFKDIQSYFMKLERPDTNPLAGESAENKSAVTFQEKKSGGKK